MCKYCFLFILVFLPTFFQAQLFLTDPIPVSAEGTGFRAPRIALLEDNRPVVYWGRTGNTPILYLAVWQDGDFGDPIAVPTNNIEPDLWGGGLGPQLATHGNSIFLVFENYGQGIYLVKSEDGGESFLGPVTVYVAPPGRVATIPSIEVDPSGNPVVSFVTTNAAEQEALYEITKSTDGGISFPPTTVANMSANGSEVCECCPAAIAAVSEEEMYLGFRNNDNNLRDIWISKSSDAGANFPEAVDIDNTDWFLQSCPQSGPNMMVTGDSIFTVFFSGANGSNIYFSSLDKENMIPGYQFQIPSIGVGNGNQNFPVIAGSGDTLAVVWQESGTIGWDIMMNWTANGSADLVNNPMIIEDKILSQQLPDMAYENGRFHIIHEDGNEGRVMYRIASFVEVVSTAAVPSPDFSFKIHPNPFIQKTTISFENKKAELVLATLFNSQGQMVKTYKTLGEIIEINNLEKGIYFLQIQKGNKVTRQKLIGQ